MFFVLFCCVFVLLMIFKLKKCFFDCKNMKIAVFGGSRCFHWIPCVFAVRAVPTRGPGMIYKPIYEGFCVH